MLSNTSLSGAYPTVTPNAIYVSPSGSDSTGNGTVNAPYKTINRAETAASAGRTVYLRAGTYPGTVMLTKSGTSGNPIVYSAYPGETAIINGSNTDYYGEAILFIKQVNYVTVQHLTLTNGQGQGLKVESANNVILKNNLVHDTQLGGYVVSGNTIILDSNELYNACLANLNGAYGSGGWPAAMSSEKPPSGSNSTNITFTNNYSHDNWGEGIDMWFSIGGAMTGNRAINNYSMDVYCDDSSNITITNNNVSATTTVHNRSDNGHPPSGIGIASETGTISPTNMIVNANTIGSGLYAGIVKFTNGYGPVTQSPNPQNF